MEYFFYCNISWKLCINPSTFQRDIEENASGYFFWTQYIPAVEQCSAVSVVQVNEPVNNDAFLKAHDSRQHSNLQFVNKKLCFLYTDLCKLCLKVLRCQSLQAVHETSNIYYCIYNYNIYYETQNNIIKLPRQNRTWCKCVTTMKTGPVSHGETNAK